MASSSRRSSWSWKLSPHTVLYCICSLISGKSDGNSHKKILSPSKKGKRKKEERGIVNLCKSRHFPDQGHRKNNQIGNQEMDS